MEIENENLGYHIYDLNKSKLWHNSYLQASRIEEKAQIYQVIIDNKYGDGKYKYLFYYDRKLYIKNIKYNVVHAIWEWKFQKNYNITTNSIIKEHKILYMLRQIDDIHGDGRYVLDGYFNPFEHTVNMKYDFLCTKCFKYFETSFRNLIVKKQGCSCNKGRK